MSLSCRFYKHRYPKLEDVVMVNVRSIAEMGAYVSLLEYNNIEGMIMLSELSRRRIRSINKLVRIGRNECVVVIRVDETKGERAELHARSLFVLTPHHVLHHAVQPRAFIDKVLYVPIRPKAKCVNISFIKRSSETCAYCTAVILYLYYLGDHRLVLCPAI